jgi:alkylation response protein AidB-like acyl-CoA dehydrogenase
MHAPAVAAATVAPKNGPDVIVAGSAVPGGAADQTAGGYRINGRWPFASGCEHADWMFAFCLETKDGAPVRTSSGGPPLRIAMLPARQWAIEDTWHSAGLKGTGSHHISLKDVFVPEATLMDPYSAQPNHSSGMLRGGIGTFVTAHIHAAVHWRHVTPLRRGLNHIERVCNP